MDAGVAHSCLNGYLVPVSHGVSDHVYRIQHRSHGRQTLSQGIHGRLLKCGHGQAGFLAGVGNKDARSAGVGYDRHIGPGWHRLVGERLGEVEQILHRIRPYDAPLPERWAEHALRASQRAGVRSCGARARRSPAGLDDDERLLASDTSCNLHKGRPVGYSLQVAHHDAAVRVVCKSLQDVDLRQHGLIADADELGEADALGGGPIQNGHA